MIQPVLSPKLTEQFELIRDILRQSIEFAERCLDWGSSKILTDRLSHLQSAALFVIVGEVKAGKSSFINALLGEDICEVAPDPCTARIQELVHGEERATSSLGENWEKITLPQEVLKEITIVDTPGTNSIIRDHEALTENYIPLSDLVIFVFAAKNPHTATAWELLTLIRKDWHRKVVFVLQQSDLATRQELATNHDRVQQYARERNVQSPRVFAVSAKRELEGAPDSGFEEFRQFLRDAVETGEVWRMKADGSRDTALRVVGGLFERLRSEQAALAKDRTFYEALLGKVKSRRGKANALRRLAVDSLGVTYDRLASRLERDFTDGLGIGTVLRRAIPYLRDKDVKTWLRDLQTDFERVSREDIEKESLRVSKDISDEIASMFDELTDAISHRQSTEREGQSAGISDRQEILSSLERQLQDLRIADIVGDQGIQGSDLGKLTLAGGGIAALGTVIALATQLLVFDITGGILALIGAGLIAATLLWKRNGIIRDFSRKLSRSRDEFRDRLDKEIARIFERLLVETEHRLRQPLERIENENARLAPLIEEANRLVTRIESL